MRDLSPISALGRDSLGPPNSGVPFCSSGPSDVLYVLCKELNEAMIERGLVFCNMFLIAQPAAFVFIRPTFQFPMWH